jgi:hypothetical protein
MAEFKANSTIGTLAVQSRWSGRTRARIICATDRIARSDAPSVCGWNDVDMNNLVPNNWCVSRQNWDVNLESRSDTIVIARPWRRTISRT